MNRLVLLFCAAFFLVFNTYALSAENDITEVMPKKIKVALLSRTLTNQPYQDPTYSIETDYVNALAFELGVETEFVIYPTVEEVHNALSSRQVDLAVGFSTTSDEKFIYSLPLYKSSIAIWYRNKNLVHMSLNSMKCR